MRISSLLFLPILALGLSPLPARAAASTLVRVWPGYREAASFVRIGEYFNRGEQTGGETVLRSRDANREGYYFLVRLENPDAPVAGVRFELSVVMPGSPTPRVYPFRSDLPKGGHVFNLGVTGSDWPGAGVQPVAWHLVIRTAAGDEIAKSQSFLWSLPPAPPAAAQK